jgi:ABC-2 type transport system permease protein
MKKSFAIILKDARVRFSSPAEWLFFIILPIIFTIVISITTAGPGDPRLQLPVVNEAQSTLSAQVIAELNASDSVRVVEKTLAEAQADFDARKDAAVLILPKGFTRDNLSSEEQTIQFLQQPGNTDALIARQAVQNALQRVSSLSDIAAKSVSMAESVKPFSSEADRSTYYSESLELARQEMTSSPARLEVAIAATPDQIDYNPKANSSAGQLITWVFIPLIGLSGTFAYERQKGTLRRLLTTPTSHATILFSTILGQVLVALVQMLLLVGFGMLVMGIEWGRSPAALALMLTLSALAAAALGTTLGTFVKTESQANGLSIMLGMVMALLGGCWYPLELFPQAVQSAVKVLPTTWAMEGLLNIVVRGGGVNAVLPQVAVLCGFALCICQSWKKRVNTEA